MCESLYRAGLTGNGIPAATRYLQSHTSPIDEPSFSEACGVGWQQILGSSSKGTFLILLPITRGQSVIGRGLYALEGLFRGAECRELGWAHVVHQLGQGHARAALGESTGGEDRRRAPLRGEVWSEGDR